MLSQEIMDWYTKNGDIVVIYKSYTIAADGSQTITFDTDDLDLNGDGVDETTPMKNKMLWLTGIIVNITGANGRLIGHIIDDGFIPIPYNTDANINNPGTSFSAGYPNSTQKFGIPAIPCRAKVGIKYTAAGADTIVVYYMGYKTNRRM